MAIAGGAQPSFQAEIIDGKLVMGRQTLRQGAITQVDTAVHRLLAGETIFLSARNDVASAVQRTIEMVLGGAGKADPSGRALGP